VESTGGLTGGTTSYAIAAVALVLLSGAVMVLAGVVAHVDGWTIAGPITIVGGVLILAAFVAARRVIGRSSYPMTLRVPALVATLISGAVMVLAGYGASAWGWWVALLLVPVGGLVIMAAFVFELDAADSET
jgi:hypothetical protein